MRFSAGFRGGAPAGGGINQLATPERWEALQPVLDDVLSQPHRGVNSRSLGNLLSMGSVIYGLWRGDRLRAEERWRIAAEMAAQTRDPVFTVTARLADI